MDTSIAPSALAHELAESGSTDWLRELVDALDREIRTEPLERLMTLWDLSASGAARLFGVSRQAFSKWLKSAPPADRSDDVASVDVITSLLDKYVKRERIPAVVRRRAEGLSNLSVIEVLEAGEYSKAADFMKSTFDLRRVQP